MRRFLHILLPVFLIACSSGTKDKKGPGDPDIIPRAKMVAILTEFQLVESSIYIKQNEGGNPTYYSNYYYQAVLKKYGVSRQEFDASLKHYKNHLDELDSIYANVVTNLSKLQSEKGGFKKKPEKAVEREDINE